MLKSGACETVSRRLNLPPNRVAHLVQRVSEAGLLPSARGSDRPDLGSLELAKLFLSAVCDRGLGNAAATVAEFASLRTEGGVNLLDVLEGLIAGRIPATSIRSAVFQLSPSGAVLISEHHLKFGASLSTDGAAKHVIVPGDALAAIALEFQGMLPQKADEFIALSRLSHALN
jgi:hypothetical protein